MIVIAIKMLFILMVYHDQKFFLFFMEPIKVFFIYFSVIFQVFIPKLYQIM